MQSSKIVVTSPSPVCTVSSGHSLINVVEITDGSRVKHTVTLTNGIGSCGHCSSVDRSVTWNRWTISIVSTSTLLVFGGQSARYGKIRLHVFPRLPVLTSGHETTFAY